MMKDLKRLTLSWIRLTLLYKGMFIHFEDCREWSHVVERGRELKVILF